ncbi:MAG: phosphodiester glycosidase family protein [Oscillospiraceae bacterium]|nr:phosphodiester glycosidase family protein [Oscillospiraceae bacterium]
MKHHKTKRGLTLFLALAMVLSLVPIFSVPAQASSAGTPFTPANVNNIHGVTYTRHVNGVSGTGFSTAETVAVLQVAPNADAQVLAGVPRYHYVQDFRTVGQLAQNHTAQGYDVIAAMNGGFFGMVTQATGGQVPGQGAFIQHGELLRHWNPGGSNEYHGQEHYLLGWTADGDFVHGHNPTHVMNMRVNGGAAQVLPALNSPRSVGNPGWRDLTLLTDRFAPTVTAEASRRHGRDVRLEVLSGRMAFGEEITLRVTQAAHAVVANAPIGRGQARLTASNAADMAFLNTLRVGDTITINHSLTNRQGTTVDWTQVDQAFATHYQLISGGVRRPLPGQAGAVTTHPLPSQNSARARTALGVRADGTMVWVVVSGGATTGMTMPQFQNYLHSMGLRYAWNLDGGGSSTMTIGHTLQTYADGRNSTFQRPVANGLVLVSPRVEVPEIPHRANTDLLDLIDWDTTADGFAAGTVSVNALPGGGYRVNILQGGGRLIRLPASAFKDLRFDLNANPYLDFNITGSDIDLIWALDAAGAPSFVHSNNTFGHGRAPMGASVNIRDHLVGRVDDLSNVELTELRFWTTAPAGTSFTIHDFRVSTRISEPRFDLFNVAPTAWTRAAGGSGTMGTITNAGGVYTFPNIGGGWPQATHSISPVTPLPRADWNDLMLYYDFTAASAFNIVFFHNDLQATNSFAFGRALSGGNIDPGSGDGRAGTYRGSITLAELFANAMRGAINMPVPGSINTFNLSAMRVFAVGGNVTFREFRIVDRSGSSNPVPSDVFNFLGVPAASWAHNPAGQAVGGGVVNTSRAGNNTIFANAGGGWPSATLDIRAQGVSVPRANWTNTGLIFDMDVSGPNVVSILLATNLGTINMGGVNIRHNIAGASNLGTGRHTGAIPLSTILSDVTAPNAVFEVHGIWVQVSSNNNTATVRELRIGRL